MRSALKGLWSNALPLGMIAWSILGHDPMYALMATAYLLFASWTKWKSQHDAARYEAARERQRDAFEDRGVRRTELKLWTQEALDELSKRLTAIEAQHARTLQHMTNLNAAAEAHGLYKRIPTREPQ